MLKSVRTSGIWALAFIVLGAWIFYGCGGGGGSGEDAIGPLAQQGHITGTVTASATLAVIKTLSGSIMAATGQGIEGARVYLESNWDTYNTLTASGGRFDLGVPYGEHRLVVVYSNSAGTFKARSGKVTISEATPGVSANELSVAPADRTVRGLLRDKDGNPLPNAVLYLWGERFQTDANGEFTTPGMPNGSEGDIVIKTTGYQETTIPASFTSVVPPYVVTTVPGNGDTNRAPIVTLRSANNDLIAPGKTVELTGLVTDPDGDLYTHDWAVTAGSLATSANILTSVWTAPSGSGIATISITATDSKGLSGKAYVGIRYGLGGNTATNFPPIVSIIATGTGYGTGFWYNDKGQVDPNYPALFIASGTTLKLTANAADGNGDPMYYYWFASTGTFDNSRNREVTYTPPGIATWGYLEVYVYDSVGAGASATKIVGISKNMPRVKITSPINNKVYTSGFVLLEGQASDTMDRLIYPGTGYSISWLLDGTTVATETTQKWLEILKPATYSLAFQVKNEIGVIGSTSVQFHVNATPAVTITSPVSGTSFGSGANIQFRGSATDAEDGAITSDAKFVWKYGSTTLGGSASITYNGFTASGTYNVNLIATDSNNDRGIATVTFTIGANASPTVSIASPTANKVFLLNESVSLVGSATDPEDGPLSGTKLTWYDGTTSLGNGTTLTTSFSTNGGHTIYLAAKDNQNYVSTASVQITINTLPTASITAPVNGSIFTPGQTISFTGQASDTEEPGVISDTARQGWYLGNWSTGTFLGSGTTYSTNSLGVGAHTITFGGIDTNGYVGTGSISVSVGNRPVLDFTPASDTVIQLNVATAFAGSVTDDGGAAMNTTTYKWYDNGSLIAGSTGQANINFTGTSVGSHLIAFEGANTNGIVGTQTKRIIVNAIPEVTLASPTTNYRYDTGAAVSIKFTASDSAETSLGSLTYVIYDQPNSVGALNQIAASQTLHNNLITVPYTLLTNATHTLYVEVHDSLYSAANAANTAATASVVILVNTLPTSTLTINTAAFTTTASAPTQVYCAQNGNVSVTFTTARTDTDGGVDNTKIVWTTIGDFSDNLQVGQTNPTINFTAAGVATIGVRVWDNFSRTERFQNIRILDNRAYTPAGLDTGIDIDGDGNDIIFLETDTVFKSTTLDFSAVDAGVAYAPNPASALAVSGTKMYSIESSSDVISYFPTTSPLTSTGFQTFAAWANVGGLSFSGANMYVCDTGNNTLRRYDLNTTTNALVTEVSSVNTSITSPGGVFYDTSVTPAQVYLANSGANTIRVYTDALNFSRSFASTNSLDVVVKDSKLFSLDGTNNLVRIHDPANGNVIATFNKFGGVGFTLPRALYMKKDTNNYYLYVLEQAAIQRFDFGNALW